MDISWTDRVRNTEVLHGEKEERNIPYTVKRGNLQGNTKGKIIQGRRCKQLLDEFKEKRGYWKLKEEALDRPVRRTGFGRGCGPVVRLRNEFISSSSSSSSSKEVPLFLTRHDSIQKSADLTSSLHRR
jgi:hypothetical protein